MKKLFPFLFAVVGLALFSIQLVNAVSEPGAFDHIATIPVTRYYEYDSVKVELFLDGHRGMYSELVGAGLSGSKILGKTIDPIAFTRGQVGKVEVLITDADEWGFDDSVKSCEFLITKKDQSTIVYQEDIKPDPKGVTYYRSSTAEPTTIAAIVPGQLMSLPESVVNNLPTDNNYYLNVECSLKSGDARVVDSMYVYVASTALSPVPLKANFNLQKNSNNQDGWFLERATTAIKLVMNDLDYGMAFYGVPSSINKHPFITTLNTLPLNVRVAQPNWLQKLAGSPTLESCSLGTFKVGSSGSLTALSSQAVSLSGDDQTIPLSLNVGSLSDNNLLKLTCTTDEGEIWDDAVFVYLIRDRHLECVNNTCTSVAGPGTNLCSTNADCAPKLQCSDGKDNDGDGKIDYPKDPGCVNASDNDEVNPKVDIKIKVLM